MSDPVDRTVGPLRVRSFLAPGDTGGYEMTASVGSPVWAALHKEQPGAIADIGGWLYELIGAAK
jgi:hypothetical protein